MAWRGADLIIILPAREDLRQQAERLAQEHRDTDGMTVTLVEAPQIYNEFSSGTPDVTAYRRLMKMLYDRAEGQPLLHPVPATCCCLATAARTIGW